MQALKLVYLYGLVNTNVFIKPSFLVFTQKLKKIKIHAHEGLQSLKWESITMFNILTAIKCTVVE